MSEYNQFIFFKDSSPFNFFPIKTSPSVFCCVVQSENSELIPALSALRIPFATTFHYPNSVRFCSESKIKLFFGIFQNGESCFFDIFFFHLLEFWMQTLGSSYKKALILRRENVKMLIRGVVAVMRVVKKHSKFTPIVFFLY